MTELGPTARVARGATWLFLQGFATAMIGVVYFGVLAHTVTEAEMGVYALLSFILTLPQIIATFALPSAAVKYISQHLAEKNVEKARSVVARVLQIGFLASAIVFLALFVPAEQLASWVLGDVGHAPLLRLLALSSVFSILYIEVLGFMQGAQRMKEVAILGFSYAMLHTFVGSSLLFMGLRLYAVVLGWLVGLCALSLAGLVFTIRSLGMPGKPYSLKPLMDFSLPLYFSASIGFFVTWVDPLILASFTNLETLGVYYVAVRAAVVPTLFSSSIITALFPQLSELYTKKGLSSLSDAFRVASRYAVLIGFPLSMGVAVLAYPTIVLLATVQFADAALPLIIISFAALMGTLGIAINPILLTLERTKIASVLALVVVGFNIFLSYLMLAVLGLGMIGAAWTRTLASVAGLVVSLLVLSRYIHISFDKEAIWKAAFASAFMVAAIILLDLGRMLLASSSYQFLVFRLYLLPVYIVVGALAYLIAIVALKGLKKQDVDFVQDYLPKKLKRIANWLRRVAKVEE